MIIYQPGEIMANCSECTYLKTDDPDLYGNYWCETKLERVSACKEACYRFCRAYSRSSYEVKDFEKYSKDNSGSPGCYLTTMLCYVLESPDSNAILNSMRDFRNNVLQKDMKYKELLVEYDIVGPVIAQNLKNDPLKYIIATECLFKYIIPTIRLIKQEKNDEAVDLYKNMTNRLKNIYNVNTTVSIEDINNTDINECGHGVYKLKKSLN